MVKLLLKSDLRDFCSARAVRVFEKIVNNLHLHLSLPLARIAVRFYHAYNMFQNHAKFLMSCTTIASKL